MTDSMTGDNPIDRGLAECVAAFVLERYDTVIGASAAATVASARRGPKPPETIGEALTVTGADPGSGAPRQVVVDHLELSRYVDEKVHQSNVSDDARAVLNDARDRAQSLHRAYIGQEHLLAALAATAGPGAQFLGRCGVDPAGIIETLDPYLQPNPNRPADNGPPCWTPRAIRALNLAQTEAARRGDPEVDSRHLVIGLLADGEGMGAAALGAAGLGVDRARSEL